MALFGKDSEDEGDGNALTSLVTEVGDGERTFNGASREVGAESGQRGRTDTPGRQKSDSRHGAKEVSRRTMSPG